MKRVALMGANGFVGSRVVEMFHLGGVVEVVPVVRGFNSLARLARMELEWRLADACDEEKLTQAFAGCELVIHAVYGETIMTATVGPTYRAAQRAGVKRIVYLSTASVHGQSPAPGTNENSPLRDRQAVSYNNAKVQAERQFLSLRKGGAVELVLLRPGIVFGPRSRWITQLAGELNRGTAYLLANGEGICNSIYVDNLVEAIRLALLAPAADGEAFLVGDRERVSWADFYGGIARGLGYDPGSIPRLATPAFPTRWKSQVKQLHGHRAVQALLPLFPAKLKESVKGALQAWNRRPDPSPWQLPGSSSPQVTQEMALLQQCQVQLPIEKARRLLGYEPVVSFEEGMQRSLGWLAFAGYPVKGEGRA